jgi:glycosyltransferase involved in cell wall biosynthesis
MNEKKSILFVNGHLNVGGAEKALIDLLRWIDYDSFDVDLLLLEGGGDYRQLVPGQVRLIQKDLRQLEGPFGSFLLKAFREGNISDVIYRSIQTVSRISGPALLKLLRTLLPVKSHYDVAIAFRPGHYAEIASYVVKADKKICWWHHGEVTQSGKDRQYLMKLLGSCDRVVTVSSGCKVLLHDAFNIPKSRLEVVPNIIDVAWINQMAGCDDPFGLDNRFRIVTLSRLSAEKHVEDVIDAASLLVGKIDFVWYIVGDGPEMSSLSDKIVGRHLDDRIVFTGNLTNPYPFLKYADLYVHPSHVESLCISVLEAMALKKPCLVVRSIGPASYIMDGQNGFLIGKGAESIADGVISVSSMDRERINSIREQGYQSVLDEFSPEYVMLKFHRLLNGQ